MTGCRRCRKTGNTCEFMMNTTRKACERCRGKKSKCTLATEGPGNRTQKNAEEDEDEDEDEEGEALDEEEYVPPAKAKGKGKA